VLFTRSQIRTRLSSAPPAMIPRFVGFHSMQFTLPVWPFNSMRAWPGWRTSRIRTRLESCEKVAMRCWSCGDAANLSKGGGLAPAPPTGDPPSSLELVLGSAPEPFPTPGSYIIVLCSKLLRSNIRTLPSAPQLANTSTEPLMNLTSKTSLS